MRGRHPLKLPLQALLMVQATWDDESCSLAAATAGDWATGVRRVQVCNGSRP